MPESALIVLAKKMDICSSDMPKTADAVGPRTHHAPFSSATSGSYGDGIVSECNQTDAEYPRDLCLHQLLEQRATQNPKLIAVEFQGHTLTYAELDSRSNQLAHFLRGRGVRAEVLVGVCVERSIEMVVALLGILKAGGAYVPLDPSYPSDRIQYVLDDARVKLLLTQESLLDSLPQTSAEVVCLAPDWQAFQDEDHGRVTAEVRPDNLAYVIYTSGSTGKPKGVQLEHRSVVNFLCSMRREPGMTSDDVLVAVTTLSFDIAGLELYLPLLVGGRLVVASRETTYDGRLLRQLLNNSGATIVQATPATWRVLLESGWEGNPKLKVLVGGRLSRLTWHVIWHCAAARCGTCTAQPRRPSGRAFTGLKAETRSWCRLASRSPTPRSMCWTPSDNLWRQGQMANSTLAARDWHVVISNATN